MKYYRTDLLAYLNIREEEGLKGSWRGKKGSDEAGRCKELYIASKYHGKALESLK